MTATTPTTDTTVLDAPDFEHAQPCEHHQHDKFHADEPAMFYVEGLCPKCGYQNRLFLCLSGWEDLGTGAHCRGCRSHFRRDDYLRILRVIGGPR